MTPYYEEAGITIYCGDCRDILPHLPKVDLILTDPPYGINAARIRNSQASGWKDYGVNGWDLQRADPKLIELAIKAGSASIVWGGNYFADILEPTDKWLIWDKGQTDFSLADVEMAWCSWKGAARRLLLPRGAVKDARVHGTQKPIALMKWAIGQVPAAKTILDPFAGSCTSLLAAKCLGINAIGIEISEEYCQIGMERLRQDVLPLMATPEPQPENGELFAEPSSESRI